MKTNRAEALIELCDIANQYYELSKQNFASEFLLQILGTLLDFESILDHARGVPLFDGDQSSLTPVHKNLDLLRANIYELIERIGKEEVVSLLESRMRGKQEEYSRVSLDGMSAL